ncbi:MAG: transposase [Planctomycetaceae bacterium]|nr:transposase [Planctomycetaceae bacterium]
MFEVSLESEFSGCDFEDLRLIKRLPMIGKKLGERPNLSIPGSLESRAEMEAAYRFFNNDNVTPLKISGNPSSPNTGACLSIEGLFVGAGHYRT